MAVELVGERDIENSGLCILEILRSPAQAAADEVVERAVVYDPVEKTCEVEEGISRCCSEVGYLKWILQFGFNSFKRKKDRVQVSL